MIREQSRGHDSDLDAAKEQQSSGPRFLAQAKALPISNDPMGCAAEQLLRQGGGSRGTRQLVAGWALGDLPPPGMGSECCGTAVWARRYWRRLCYWREHRRQAPGAAAGSQSPGGPPADKPRVGRVTGRAAPRIQPAGKECLSRTGRQGPHPGGGRQSKSRRTTGRQAKGRLDDWAGSAPDPAGGQGVPLPERPSGPTPGAAAGSQSPGGTVFVDACSIMELLVRLEGSSSAGSDSTRFGMS